MKIKDLKVGMNVFIREDLKVGEEYGIETFVEDMKYLTGLQQVTRIGNKIIGVGNRYWRFTSEMIDWNKTKELNNKNSALLYDGTILKGKIDGQEIKVIRSPKDEEDLEKAVMMGLLKSLGYSYDDVKKLQNIIKKVWRPKYREKYYYIMSDLEVKCGYNDDYSMDNRRIQVGNCFETVEEAEKKVIEVKGLFRK